jgi:hypothetical protein
VVLKALDRNLKSRFQTAAEFAACLEVACAGAVPREVGRQVRRLCGSVLEARTHAVTEIVQHSAADPSRSMMVNRLLRPRRPEEAEPTIAAPEPSFDETSTTAEINTAGQFAGSLRRYRAKPAALATAAALLLAATLITAILTIVPRALFVEPAAASRSSVAAAAPSRSPNANKASDSAFEESLSTPIAASAEPVASVEPPAPRRTAVRRTTVRPKPVKKPSCDPPTYTAADGIIKFKRECL